MQARAGDMLNAIFTGLATEERRGLGPVKWCNRCSRKHARHVGCDQAHVVKDGRLVVVHRSRLELADG
jgi:hypothetical protein